MRRARARCVEAWAEPCPGTGGGGRPVPAPTGPRGVSAPHARAAGRSPSTWARPGRRPGRVAGGGATPGRARGAGAGPAAGVLAGAGARLRTCPLCPAQRPRRGEWKGRWAGSACYGLNFSQYRPGRESRPSRRGSPPRLAPGPAPAPRGPVLPWPRPQPHRRSARGPPCSDPARARRRRRSAGGLDGARRRRRRWRWRAWCRSPRLPAPRRGLCGGPGGGEPVTDPRVPRLAARGGALLVILLPLTRPRDPSPRSRPLPAPAPATDARGCSQSALRNTPVAAARISPSRLTPTPERGPGTSRRSTDEKRRERHRRHSTKGGGRTGARAFLLHLPRARPGRPARPSPAPPDPSPATAPCAHKDLSVACGPGALGLPRRRARRKRLGGREVGAPADWRSRRTRFRRPLP